MTPSAGLQRLQTLGFISQTLPEIGGSRNWRKGQFKKYFEEYQSALFTYGLSQGAISYHWEYSYGESQNREFDCAIRCELPQEDGGVVVKPVQLKELPPDVVNPQVSLQDLINSLVKYTAQAGEEMLAVAIFCNRGSSINFKKLTIPPLQIAQLWIYGFLDHQNCFLVEIGSAARLNFNYPRFTKVNDFKTSNSTPPSNTSRAQV